MVRLFFISAIFFMAQNMAWAQSANEGETPQPSEAAATEATTTTQDDGGTTPDELSLGTDGAEVQRGERYIKETNGDWELRCIVIDGTNDACEMYQLLKDQNGNAVAEVSLFRLKNAGRAVAGATILAPLETLLTAQLSISVDGGKVKRYPFAFCNANGCAARIGLTQEDVNAFKRGRNARVSLVPAAAPDQVVGLSMSLSGFTASYGNATVASR